MRKGDLIWSSIQLLLAVFLSIGKSRALYTEMTTKLPYIVGFLKFAILASMGELLTLRIKSKRWMKSSGFPAKAIIWGLIGMMITFMFRFYSTGVIAVQATGVLPGEGVPLVKAFFTSALMSLTFGPAFMIFHRFSDTLIEHYARQGSFPSFTGVLEKIDWATFFNVIIRTLFLFWIPAHTVVFMLPGQFQVLAAALLSIFLGLFLSLAGNRKRSVCI